jgi:hypothetical protein
MLWERNIDSLLVCKLKHHLNSFTVSLENLYLLLLLVIHTINIKTVTLIKFHLLYSDPYVTNGWCEVFEIKGIWAQYYKCIWECLYLKDLGFSANYKIFSKLFCKGINLFLEALWHYYSKYLWIFIHWDFLQRSRTDFYPLLLLIGLLF